MEESDREVELLPPDPPFWTKTSWLQLGYGVWVNLTIMGIGLAFGFPAVTIPQLKEEDSEIQISVSEEAWIVSVLTLSSPIGCILCGILMDRYGRRIVLVLCAIPTCFGWFYTGFADTARDIIIGRVIGGIGLGMAISAPRAYITEITLPNMRGVIGALPNLFISFGLTIQAGLGSFLKWHVLCYICGCYSVIMMIANLFLPDTPYFLLMKPKASTISSAKINLRRFRSSKFNVDAELEALYDFRKENNIRSLSLKDQIKALFKSSSCKPYGIVTVYIIFMQLAGVNVVIMWAVEMLMDSKTSVNAHLGNFMLALTRIFVGVLTSVLMFKVRRRVMAMISAIGVGVVAIGLCVFLFATQEQTVLPLFMFMAYIGFATLGYYTLPFLMMFELLPLQIRGLLSGICLSQLNLLIFAMNNCYPYLRQKFGLGYTIGMFGVFSLIGALVLFFILPETKDLTLQEIEEFFNSRRSTLVSQRRVMSDQLNDGSKKSFGRSKTNLNVRKLTDKKQKESTSKTNEKNYKEPKEEDLRIKSSNMDVREKDSKGRAKNFENSQINNKKMTESLKDKNKSMTSVEMVAMVDLKDKEKKSIENKTENNLKEKSSKDSKGSKDSNNKSTGVKFSNNDPND